MTLKSLYKFRLQLCRKKPLCKERETMSYTKLRKVVKSIVHKSQRYDSCNLLSHHFVCVCLILVICNECFKLFKILDSTYFNNACIRVIFERNEGVYFFRKWNLKAIVSKRSSNNPFKQWFLAVFKYNCTRTLDIQFVVCSCSYGNACVSQDLVDKPFAC